MSVSKGHFISLEGGEGAGKTTQAERIKEALVEAGFDAIITREPGGTFGAEAIRDLVLSGSQDRWSGMTELLLMYAARVDHVEKLIKPALERGTWVLCDRFADSSLVYQGFARGIGAERVAAIHGASLDGFAPEITFLFDIDPILTKSRVRNRGEELSRFDAETLDFHKKIRDGFLQIAKEDPERFITLDAASSRDAITIQIVNALKAKFPELGRGKG